MRLRIPAGMAVRHNELIIADYGNNAIRRYLLRPGRPAAVTKADEISPMSKRSLLQVAVDELMRHGLSALSVSSLAERMELPETWIRSRFPGGDWQLRMDAVEYAAPRAGWSRFGALMRAQKTPREKISLLCRAYALGSRDLPASLDSYLDLWKQARDGNGGNPPPLGGAVSVLFRAVFRRGVRSRGSLGDEATRTAFASLVTLLSDMLHLQGMLGNPVDFAKMGRLLEQLAAVALLEES